MKGTAIFLALFACKTPSEGRPVPAELRARAIEFENRKAECVRISRSDDEFAECLGVSFEDLSKDQTGLKGAK